MRRRYKDIDTAIKIYYLYPEIGNAEIRELFGSNLSSSTLTNYKKDVLKRQTELGVKTAVPHSVNTKTAFEVWGIDVDDLEIRRRKLKELGYI